MESGAHQVFTRRREGRGASGIMRITVVIIGLRFWFLLAWSGLVTGRAPNARGDCCTIFQAWVTRVQIITAVI